MNPSRSDPNHGAPWQAPVDPSATTVTCSNPQKVNIMALQRVLEPEVMDTEAEARDYNAMDHGEVNQRFVTDLLGFAADQLTPEQHEIDLGNVLDLGTGTALIPVELCQQCENCRVLAIDLAVHMLDLARYNVEAAGLIERITLQKVDAKELPYDSSAFDVVMSNSIIHHIPEPLDTLREMARVTADGGILFVRDLLRPDSDAEVLELVEMYTRQENEHSRQMFEDSLRAALSLEEIREMVNQLGFETHSATATSDRHWTWAAIRNS